MNSFMCIVLAAIISVAAATGYSGQGAKYAAAAPAHAGPAHSYTYQSQVASVPCAKNLLFSCAPSVAPVPCHAAPHYSAPSYSAPSYSAAPAAYSAPAAAPAASYSAPAGAYSQYSPRYALPAFRPYY